MKWSLNLKNVFTSFGCLTLASTNIFILSCSDQKFEPKPIQINISGMDFKKEVVKNKFLNNFYNDFYKSYKEPYEIFKKQINTFNNSFSSIDTKEIVIAYKEFYFELNKPVKITLVKQNQKSVKEYNLSNSLNTLGLKLGILLKPTHTAIKKIYQDHKEDSAKWLEEIKKLFPRANDDDYNFIKSKNKIDWKYDLEKINRTQIINIENTFKIFNEFNLFIKDEFWKQSQQELNKPF